MRDEKKTSYTDARARAIQKYMHESVENIQIRVPKGQKAIIKAYADSMGESLNAFVIRAINETMQRNRKEGKAS